MKHHQRSRAKHLINGYGVIEFRRLLWKSAQLSINPRCDYCNAKLTKSTATLDHVIPLGRRGLDDETNWAMCCRACNDRKGQRLPEEADMKRLRER